MDVRSPCRVSTCTNARRAPGVCGRGGRGEGHRAAARVFHDTLGGVGRARGLRIAPARRGAHRRRPGRERGEARRAHPRAWRRDEAAPSLTREWLPLPALRGRVASRADAQPRTEECECRSHVEVMKKPRGSPVRAECDPAHCGPGAVRFQPSYYGSVRNKIYARGAVLAARPDAMSDDRALKSWVSDQLHGLLGFAEGNLASYVVGLGTSRRERPFPRRRRIDLHSFPAACLSRERQPLTSVRSHPGPVSSPRPLAPQARRRRTPRRSPRSSCRRVCPTRPRRERSPRASSIACPARAAVAGARRARHKRDEREAAALAAKNRSYAMLEDDDEDARGAERGARERRHEGARRRRVEESTANAR